VPESAKSSATCQLRLQVPLGDRAAMVTSRFAQWDRGAALTNLVHKSGPQPDQGLDEAVDQWAASGHWQASSTWCSCVVGYGRANIPCATEITRKTSGLDQAVELWAGLSPFSCCFRDHAFTFGTCILEWPGREASSSKTPCATEVTRVHSSSSAITAAAGHVRAVPDAHRQEQHASLSADSQYEFLDEKCTSSYIAGPAASVQAVSGPHGPGGHPAAGNYQCPIRIGRSGIACASSSRRCRRE